MKIVIDFNTFIRELLIYSFNKHLENIVYNGASNGKYKEQCDAVSASGVCINDPLQSTMWSNVIRKVDTKCNKGLEDRQIISNGDHLNCTLKK